MDFILFGEANAAELLVPRSDDPRVPGIGLYSVFLAIGLANGTIGANDKDTGGFSLWTIKGGQSPRREAESSFFPEMFGKWIIHSLLYFLVRQPTAKKRMLIGSGWDY